MGQVPSRTKQSERRRHGVLHHPDGSTTLSSRNGARRTSRGRVSIDVVGVSGAPTQQELDAAFEQEQAAKHANERRRTLPHMTGLDQLFISEQDEGLRPQSSIVFDASTCTAMPDNTALKSNDAEGHVEQSTFRRMKSIRRPKLRKLMSAFSPRPYSGQDSIPNSPGMQYMHQPSTPGGLSTDTSGVLNYHTLTSEASSQSLEESMAKQDQSRAFMMHPRHARSQSHIELNTSSSYQDLNTRPGSASLYQKRSSMSLASSNLSIKSHRMSMILGRGKQTKPSWPQLRPSPGSNDNWKRRSDAASVMMVTYQWVQGRRRCVFDYGVDDMLPGDWDDVRFSNNFHDILGFISRRNCYAPIISPKRALDVGCCSGVWMREMAERFPKCQFIGIDLVDVFAHDRAPKNCSFQIANVLEKLPFPPSHFDYIHQRMLIFNIPTYYYPEIFKEYHRVLKSGGYLEIVECDFRLEPAGPVSQRINTMLRTACIEHHVDLDHATEMDRELRTIGFRRVNMETLRIPVGAWADVTGEMVVRELIGQIFANLEECFLRLGLLEDPSDALDAIDDDPDEDAYTQDDTMPFSPYTTYAGMTPYGSVVGSPTTSEALTHGPFNVDVPSTAYRSVNTPRQARLFEYGMNRRRPSMGSCIRHRVTWDIEAQATGMKDLLERFAREASDRQVYITMHIYTAEKA